MKRILSLLLFSAVLLAASPAKSQQTMTNSIDSLVDATTGYATATIYTPVDLVTISFVLTKATSGGGTVAGRCLPQGSIDGTNYVDISTDTLAFTNATTNKKIWTFTKAPYKYYRTAATTSGTQKSFPVSKIFTRLPPKT